MNAHLCFLLLVSAVSAKTIDFTWHDCQNPSDHGHVSKITVDPDPGQTGKNVTLTGKGSIDIPVSGGEFELDIKVGGVKIFTHKASVCGNSDFELPLHIGHVWLSLLSCPISAGDVTLVFEIFTANSAPDLTLDIDVTAKSPSNQGLLCLNVVSKIH
eukprot:TRINITY_DN17718_c0_g1_i1.p1 TRINITY_DN17718_c0_g1~~TRINITY_DN17718_c0_g1_i1.p1  ORF type:complete len:157 (-),score=20.68 TRINITY_DN17718_c0_g1_i1:95-565(-)